MFRHATRAVVGCAALLLLAAPTARAQWSPSFVAKAGATIPIGDFGEVTSLGYNVGVGAEFTKPATALGFRLELDFHENSLDEDVFGESDIKWRHIAGIANLTYQQPTSNLFLIGGVGVYRGYLSDVDASDDTNFGLNGGIGYRFNLTGFSTFIEARFHHLFNDNEAVDAKTQFIPISFGVRF